MSHDEWTIDKLLKVAGGYWETCTVQAGVRLDIFTQIGEESVEAEELARRLRGDARGLATLLNALAAMGLLVKEGSRYANTAPSRSYLAKGSPQYVGHMIKHYGHLLSAWSKLPDAVMSGKPAVSRSARDEEERESFLMGMFNLARELAPKIASEIDLTARRHLLDLGGGPGTYAIFFCRANPDLRATIFDLPTTEPFALRTVEQFGLKDRIDFMAGDYIEGDIEGSYDVAWLSHILHGEGPEDGRSIIEKTVSVLEPGSLIFVHDFILADTLDGPLFPAIFSLNMLLNTPRGRSYSEAQIKDMLSSAGVKQIRRLPFEGANDSGIICGTL
jgi:predicted O-methyltransferase YrrM